MRLARAQVTRVNLGGYAIAFAGVCWYNYKKLQRAMAKAGQAPQPAALPQKPDPERALLFDKGGADKAASLTPLLDSDTIKARHAESAGP